jgi:hypothetical protein
VESVSVQVDAEAAGRVGVGAVQRTGAALLASVAGLRHEAQQGEDLGDGDGRPQGREVKGWARAIEWCWRLLVLGLAQLLAALASLGQFAVALSEDFLVPTVEFVFGRDVTDGAVQADQIVIGHVLGDEAACLLQRQRHFDADALAFESFVPAFFFAVGLGIVRRGAHVGHAGEADELFEILGDKLRPVVGDEAWPGVGEEFASALQDGFHVGFLHLFADFPVDDKAAATIENAAQVIEGSGDIEVADIDMPVLVGLQRLNEAGAFFAGHR